MRERVSITMALIAGILAGIVIIGAGTRTLAPMFALEYINAMPIGRRLALAWRIARGKI